MNAISAGITAFNDRALVPEEEFGWDTFEARVWRYSHYAAYYNNTIYSHLSRYALLHKSRYRLYNRIRPVYNPVARQNDLLVSYIYGGTLDVNHPAQGAIPLACDQPALLEAIQRVFVASRWGEQKSLFTRWGALYGDVVLKIVDEREKQRVRLEILHPAKIRQADFDAVGNVQQITIEYQKLEDEPLPKVAAFGTALMPMPRWYTYGEQWFTDPAGKRWVKTTKNGKPFAYYRDADGKQVDTWENEYGFVPMVVTNFQSTGLNWGGNSFHGSLRKIDEVNDFASLLNDQVRKNVVVPWFFAGVASGQKIDVVGADNPDEVPYLTGPAGSDPKAMVANLPIGDSFAMLNGMLAELEHDMPELSMQHIRDTRYGLTAPGVRAGYSDAIGRITEARGCFDQGLVRAVQMAVSVGGFGRYPGYERFSLDSYQAGDLDFTIKDRPVIDDTLDLGAKLTALGQIGQQPIEVQKLMLRELNYSDSEIAAVTNEAAQKAAAPKPSPITPQSMTDVANVWQKVGAPLLTAGQTTPPAPPATKVPVPA